MSDELLKRLDGVAEMGVGGSELCGLAAARIRALESKHLDLLGVIAKRDEEVERLQSDLAAARAELAMYKHDSERNGRRIRLIIKYPNWLRLHRNKNKEKWSFASPVTNYEYELFDSAIDAIDAALPLLPTVSEGAGEGEGL